MINETNEIKNIELVSFESAVELVKEEVGNNLSASPFIIRNYLEHLKKSRGKFIRAISLLICAMDKDDLISENAIKMGAAVEIMHLATLVHDDVIDNADLRRGEITLQKKFGRKTAVICGDYLFCAALNIVATISHKEDYLQYSMNNYMGKVCLGELNQHINNGNVDLSLFQYFKIISGKTAALFEASFYGGAIFSGCLKEELVSYKKLGFYLGMIFQLTDDCIDFDTTVDVAKKPVQSDFEQGVITLPLIHAFHKVAGLRDKAKMNRITRDEINKAVSDSEGVKYTFSVSKKYYDKSMKIINHLDITEEKRVKLISILDKASRFA